MVARLFGLRVRDHAILENVGHRESWFSGPKLSLMQFGDVQVTSSNLVLNNIARGILELVP